MTNVWVLTQTRGMTYEGDTYVLGVYSTEDKAREAASGLDIFEPGVPEEFELDAPRKDPYA